MFRSTLSAEAQSDSTEYATAQLPFIRLANPLLPPSTNVSAHGWFSLCLPAQIETNLLSISSFPNSFLNLTRFTKFQFYSIDSDLQSLTPAGSSDVHK